MTSGSLHVATCSALPCGSALAAPGTAPQAQAIASSGNSRSIFFRTRAGHGPPAPRHGAIDGGRSGRARGLDRTWTRRGVCGAASAADSHPTSARAWQALRESAETSITLRLYPRLMRSRLQTSPSCHQEARPPAPSSPRRQLQQPHRPRHRLSPHRPSLPHSSPPRQLPPRRRQSP